MTPDFTDLAIGPINEKETYQRSGQFWEYAFELSAPVPEGWAEVYFEVWDGAEYEPKRHSRIENGLLLTICLPAELNGEHMRFLHAAVSRTNAAFRQSLNA